MLSESFERVENYLKDVDEQISCKIGLDSVNRELRGHIEDKAAFYMEYGVEEKEAYRRSVRDMGAPDVVGMELNKRHRLRIAKPLLVLILVLMAVGAAGELLRDGMEWNLSGILFEISDKRHYLWGLLVLFLVMRFGYPFLLKHARGMCVFFIVVCACLGGLYLSFTFFPGWLEYAYKTEKLPGTVLGILWMLNRSALYLGIVQIGILVGTVIFYRRRNQYFKGMLLIFFFQAAGILIASRNIWGENTYIPVLMLLSSCLGVTLYILKKGWTNVGKGKGAAAAFAGFLILLILWAAPQWNRVKESWQVFLEPGGSASVTDAWDDAYNNVLIRELLPHAKPFGEIQLTEEEMLRYGTSQWYYEDGEGVWHGEEEPAGDTEDFESYVEYKMQFLEEPSLRNILPQYYLENYRVSWWILRYGWVPALFLTALVLALPILALGTAFRIKNRLGRAVAFTSGLALSIETVVYLIESLGFQFGEFINLPFVSEGLTSITGSAVLAGMILSAYRFDIVIDEREQEHGLKDARQRLNSNSLPASKEQ